MTPEEAGRKIKALAGSGSGAPIPKVLNGMWVMADTAAKKNFAEQGRSPKWLDKKRPDGRAILTGKTGRLQRTINTIIDFASKLIKQSSNLPYSKIQQEGGVIIQKPRQQGFRRKKGRSVFSSVNDRRTTKIVIAKIRRIRITARPYMKLLKEDFIQFVNNLKRIF